MFTIRDFHNSVPVVLLVAIEEEVIVISIAVCRINKFLTKNSIYPNIRTSLEKQFALALTFHVSIQTVTPHSST